MRMKTPLHPGAVIADALDQLRVPIADAAIALGVSRQHLHRLIAGKARVSADMALRLEKSLGSTAKTWLAIQASYDLSRAPKVKASRLSAA